MRRRPLERAPKDEPVSQQATFYCLRCTSRFPMSFDPKQVVERSCPKCGSNSVRLETPAAAASHETANRQARGG
jgi:Zn finger protein HypA/HybF involved in hydrogenase expression